MVLIGILQRNNTMLKKILILCFLLSGFLFSQQYSNDKYEKYVGTQLGKYPLTVSGLKDAISALDSGVVYISYPGLWDTTGLGSIKSNVTLSGWLFGIHYLGRIKLDRTKVSVTIGDTTDIVTITDNADNTHTSGKIGLRTYKYGDTWRGGQLEAYKNWGGTALDSYNSIFSLAAVVEGFSNSNIYTSGGAIRIKTGKNIISPGRVPTLIDFLTTNNVDSWLDPAFRMTQYGNFIAAQGIYANFQGDFLTPIDTNNTAYLFYGNGDYPSYFGGDLQADGDVIKFENMPSDSTSLTSGQLYYDSNGFVKRKF